MIVIFNPGSGSFSEETRDLIVKALRERGAEFDIHETTPEVGADEICARAVQQGERHVVACGGDGTVMACVNGLGRESMELKGDDRPLLSIVPGGTANLLARALGISLDAEEAVATAVAGQDIEIDLGRCGEYLFALGLGLGLTEKLVSQASAQEKEKLGKLAYVKAMLVELGARPHGFSYRLDDGPEHSSRGVAIVIANAGHVGGRLDFAPDAKMDDGKLDLCILHRFEVRDLFRLAWASLRGQLPKDRAVTFKQAQRFEITSDPPLDLQIDGEEVEQTTPLKVEVVPHALRVRVPVESPVLEDVEENA